MKAFLLCCVRKCRVGVTAHLFRPIKRWASTPTLQGSCRAPRKLLDQILPPVRPSLSRKRGRQLAAATVPFPEADRHARASIASPWPDRREIRMESAARCGSCGRRREMRRRRPLQSLAARRRILPPARARWLVVARKNQHAMLGENAGQLRWLSKTDVFDAFVVEKRVKFALAAARQRPRIGHFRAILLVSFNEILDSLFRRISSDVKESPGPGLPLCGAAAPPPLPSHRHRRHTFRDRCDASQSPNMRQDSRCVRQRQSQRSCAIKLRAQILPMRCRRFLLRGVSRAITNLRQRASDSSPARRRISSPSRTR